MVGIRMETGHPIAFPRWGRWQAHKGPDGRGPHAPPGRRVSPCHRSPSASPSGTSFVSFADTFPLSRRVAVETDIRHILSRRVAVEIDIRHILSRRVALRGRHPKYPQRGKAFSSSYPQGFREVTPGRSPHSKKNCHPGQRYVSTGAWRCKAPEKNNKHRVRRTARTA